MADSPISPASAELLFSAVSDLLREGRIGAARLDVYADVLRRYDEDRLVDEFPTKELKDPAVEDLVDSSALTARWGNRKVELLRCTNGKSIELASAQHQLKLLLEGKPLPEFAPQTRNCKSCGKPLPTDSDVCPACLNRGKTLVRLFEFTRPYKWRLIWGTVLVVLGTIVALLPPFLTRHLVDDVLTDRKTDLFPWLIGALVLTQATMNLIQMARGRNVAYLSKNVAIDIRTRLFHKLQQLSLSFYDKRNVGSLMSRVTNDTGALYDVLVDGIPITVNNAALLLGIPIAMFALNWQIALYAMIPIPIVLYAVNRFRRRMMRVWSRYWHSWSRMSSTLSGVLQGTKVVRAFHGEDHEETKFGRRIRDLADTGYIAELGWSNFFPLVMFTMSLAGFVIWYFGGNSVLAGKMTIGELTAFIGYIALMREPLMMLQRLIDWVSRSLTAAERVFEILDMPLDIQDSETAVSLPQIKGDVVFENVHFGYEKAREIVHGVDLEVKAGEMIGLVGHSGAGKSTLINLLLRFYDPTQGKITIDGVDLPNVKMEDLRRQVGVVLQDSYLFPGSIRHNIAYGRPEATIEEIISAAHAANAHHFIANFPDGYDTYVGERGHRLSGGERQRIAIARAILHDPRILILDEATASVDTETERMIQEGLDRLVKGRTVFAVAHRLSTLRSADRLVVMKDGKVAEVGTHDELLAEPNGIYSKLVKMQLEMNKNRDNFIGVTDEEPEEAQPAATS